MELEHVFLNEVGLDGRLVSCRTGRALEKSVLFFLSCWLNDTVWSVKYALDKGYLTARIQQAKKKVSKMLNLFNFN